jgi:hypothetical protein
MKRLFIGLTLLLMSFLSALEAFEGLRRLAAGAGAYRWVPELVLACLVVAMFLYASSLHRRLLFPRRGSRLLATGIALYAVAVAIATGAIAWSAGMLPLEKDSALAVVPDLATRLVPQPVFLLAQVLLVIGAFRALSNLVPPAEFAEDF